MLKSISTQLSTVLLDCAQLIENFAQWISWFLSSKGNEYFCEVDEDFILDRFNLTGLNNEVANYPQALDLITDNLGKSLLLNYFPVDIKQSYHR